MSRCAPFFALLLGLALLVSVCPRSLADSAGNRTPRDVRYYLDFDEDGDPWTLQSFVDSDSSRWFNLILETPDDVPLGEWFWAIVIEPACAYFNPDLNEDACWYLCAVREMEWDPAYISGGALTRPEVPGCPWTGVEFTVAENAPMVPHQRYVIGRGLAVPDCGPPPLYAEQCLWEPRSFRMWFKEYDRYSNEMTFGCRGSSGIEGTSAARLELRPVRPNPVRDRLALSVLLDRAGRIRLTVHDLSGRLLRVVYEGEAPAGERSFACDFGSSSAGARLSSGIYFARLEADRDQQDRMFVVVR